MNASLSSSHNDFLSYAIWNNKGGVGKTFLTFMMATEYARVNSDRTVVVIDMCPQANISEILLGGNGKGASELNKLLSKSPRGTVGGYFDQRIGQPHTKTGTETSFLTHLKPINENIPDNMFLIAGDPSLELQAEAINQIAVQSLPPESWRNVHTWLRDLASSIKTQNPNAVFFIDCNPSFAAYTELALLAATRLIIPCTADGSSARAIDNVGQLLFGANVPAVYKSVNFNTKAQNYSLELPRIHLVPLNRSTQYDNSASKAFGAMYDEIKQRVISLQSLLPQKFTYQGNTAPFLDIPDSHAVSIVASNLGKPLDRISSKRYTIHGIEAQVNRGPLDRYKLAAQEIVKFL